VCVGPRRLVLRFDQRRGVGRKARGVSHPRRHCCSAPRSGARSAQHATVAQTSLSISSLPPRPRPTPPPAAFAVEVTVCVWVPGRHPQRRETAVCGPETDRSFPQCGSSDRLPVAIVGRVLSAALGRDCVGRARATRWVSPRTRGCWCCWCCSQRSRAARTRAAGCPAPASRSRRCLGLSRRARTHTT